MDSEAFVEGVKLHVRDAAVESCMEFLAAPVGRRLKAQERDLSEWFKALPPEDASRARALATLAAHQAVFGLLAALDGSRAIHVEGGRFELTHVAGKREWLNDPQRAGLAELLNAQQ